MKPQIISIDGKDFNVTVTPVHADRGLDVTEVFTLLPLAMIAANDINKQLTLLKEGQNAAVSVANCIIATITLVWSAIVAADVSGPAIAVANKILAYVKAIAVTVTQIEGGVVPDTKK